MSCGEPRQLCSSYETLEVELRAGKTVLLKPECAKAAAEGGFSKC